MLCKGMAQISRPGYTVVARVISASFQFLAAALCCITISAAVWFPPGTENDTGER
ncbi:MAG: hypothetical protein LBD48_13705 [Treponema sp.]|nr:hypothetical protein [Treponema sp.]